MEENKKLSVVIIGGGLVGSLCACFMARKGYDVRLYECREDIRLLGTSRGRSINMALSNRGRDALRVVGLEEEVLSKAIPMKGRFIHETCGLTKSIPYDRVSQQCIYSIGRNYLNQLLLNAAEQFPNVTLQFNHRLVHPCFDKEEIIIEETKTKEKITVKADLFIGADGVHSTLRTAMQKTQFFEFSQNYIGHGYVELHIPAERGDGLAKNHLHIWPRQQFMMIALPNQDCSWTVTLFMPFERFDALKAPQAVLEFFDRTFSDALPLIGADELVSSFLSTRPSLLAYVKCSSFNINNFVIVGDAAHAVVPFYGQGMNAGFEDCIILSELLNTHQGSIEKCLAQFSDTRKENAYAISELSLYNFLEMRDLVTHKLHHLRKRLDDVLFHAMPHTWIPLYNSVTFSRMGYKQCMQNHQWQNMVIRNVCLGITCLLSVAVIFLIFTLR